MTGSQTAQLHDEALSRLGRCVRSQDRLLVWAAVGEIPAGRATVREVTTRVARRRAALGRRPLCAFTVAALLWELADEARLVALPLPGGAQVWARLADAGAIIAASLGPKDSRAA